MKFWAKNLLAHRAPTLHQNFLSSSGFSRCKSLRPHLTLCPWYHPRLQFKVTKKCFLPPKGKKLRKSVWPGGETQGSALCFLLEFPTSAAAVRRV